MSLIAWGYHPESGPERRETEWGVTDMTTTLRDMSDADLRAAANRYDRIRNEGGEGYSPYRSEIAERERARAIARPRTQDDILRDLEREDCSIARECGTYSAERVAALKAELAALRDAEDAAFLAVWTREVTDERRATWIAAITAMAARNGGKCPPREVYALRNRLGYWHEDIRRARKLHGIA